jgi:hypothetical protein
MKFIVYRTSDTDKKEPIKINTLKDLLEFTDKEQHPVIVFNDIPNAPNRVRYIEIYDDHRE